MDIGYWLRDMIPFQEAAKQYQIISMIINQYLF